MARFNRSSSPDSSQEMSFIDHLEELRWHVVRSAAVILGMAILIFVYIDFVFDRIVFGPMRSDFFTYTGLCEFSRFVHLGDALCMPPPNVQMQVTEFGSQFMSSITLSVIGGFILAFPYVFWEVWRFIKPALSAAEIRKSRFAIFWVSFFFFLGVLFGYFLLAPFTFSFLSNFKIGTLQAIETKPTLSDYVDNMVNIILGTGLSFELPVIAYVLTRVGLITPAFMAQYRKYAYVVILVVAAIITPSPDWMSQLIVALPLFVLYEVAILVSMKVHKEEQSKAIAYFND